MVTRIQPAVSDPDAARSVVQLLGRLPECEPAAPAADSTRLLDLLDGLAAASVTELPEVVLVHELIGPLPALELIREIALRFPAVGVVLVTHDTSPSLYSAAMDSGARGVVGLPLAQEELAARVEGAAAWATGVRRHLTGAGPGVPEPGGEHGAGGTLVAVTGAKGGVGTTLTAVQLALAAVASGRSTALVDMDLQSGDVASYLDVQFRRSVADLAGIRDISPRVLQDAVFAHESGVGLLLAPGEGERGEEVDDAAARQILGAVRDRYEVVIVDCGAQMTSGNAAAVELADAALLLTTPDVVAVRAAKRMVRMWGRLRIRKAEETLTVVNRAARTAEIQPPLVARIVGTPVARTTVPSNFKELQTALDAGRMQDLDSRGAVRQSLWGLAGELGLVAGESADVAGSAGSGSGPASGVGAGLLRKRGRGGRRRSGSGDAGTGAGSASQGTAQQRALAPGGPAPGTGRHALPPGSVQDGRS
ncbi:AAA family ATPase [Streptomyces sp. ODS28]|uniref:AAA family ATPase n=1 Tax=Streptomyces sp. ODS28 TaxID=3136688 RepID=UPI0031EC58E1